MSHHHERKYNLVEQDEVESEIDPIHLKTKDLETVVMVFPKLRFFYLQIFILVDFLLEMPLLVTCFPIRILIFISLPI